MRVEVIGKDLLSDSVGGARIVNDMCGLFALFQGTGSVLRLYCCCFVEEGSDHLLLFRIIEFGTVLLSLLSLGWHDGPRGRTCGITYVQSSLFFI